MVKGKFLSPLDDLSDIKRIRDEVFVKELKINSTKETDHWKIGDQTSMHAIAYYEDVPVGCGRISFDGEQYEISLIAVLKDYRRKKLGDFIVRMLADRAFQNGGHSVFLFCQEDIIPFFEQVGFGKVEPQEIRTIDYLNENSLGIKMRLEENHFCSACSKM